MSETSPFVPGARVAVRRARYEKGYTEDFAVISFMLGSKTPSAFEAVAICQ